MLSSFELILNRLYLAYIISKIKYFSTLSPYYYKYNMSSIFIPKQPHYEHLLATFKKQNGKTAFKGDGTPMLNSVRSIDLDEVPEKSIGVLQIGASHAQLGLYQYRHSWQLAMKKCCAL